MDKVKDAPGPQDINKLFPLSAPVAYNVSMKLPVFWPNTTNVWFTQVLRGWLITLYSLNDYQ